MPGSSLAGAVWGRGAHGGRRMRTPGRQPGTPGARPARDCAAIQNSARLAHDRRAQGLSYSATCCTPRHAKSSAVAQHVRLLAPLVFEPLPHRPRRAPGTGCGGGRRMRTPGRQPGTPGARPARDCAAIQNSARLAHDRRAQGLSHVLRDGEDCVFIRSCGCNIWTTTNSQVQAQQVKLWPWSFWCIAEKTCLI